MLELNEVRTETVAVGVFHHPEGDAPNTSEWWRDPCIVFTTHGAWEVESAEGRAQLTPGSLLAAPGSREYACYHPGTLDDRGIFLSFFGGEDVGPRLAVPASQAMRRLRHGLTCALRRASTEGLDEIGMALLELVRGGGDTENPPSRRAQELVATLRRDVDARYTALEFDFVAEAAALGLTRTRFVHVFNDVVGITPHRYLMALRVTHAARMLRCSDAPVIEVCFASGFGSLARFYASFRDAFGIAPGPYRRLQQSRGA